MAADKELELDSLQGASIDAAPTTHRHQSDSEIMKKNSNVDTLGKANSTPQLPIDMEKRHVSIHDSNEKAGLPRASTQMSPRGGPRKSVEFDRRTDGPFGRPSITMTRRASQQQGAIEEPVPELPVLVTDGGATHAAPEVVPYQPEPPPLNYELWSRKWWIIGFWSLVVFDTVICPVGLYFGLWYGLYLNGRMTPNIVFSIVTAAIGGCSIIEYGLRFWRLVKKRSKCRVIDGAKWWYLDFFHWNFTVGWLIVMIELIVATIQVYPPARLIAMCVPTMLYVFAVELLTLDTFRYFELPAPLRLSSIPEGAQVRPGIYTIIEDVIAVDGSGGTAYREALNIRYEASHVFRAMLRRLGLFWSIGSMATAVICTILIFTIHIDAAYTIGWTLPFVWAGVWTVMTIWYVKRKLKEEKVAWREAIEEKSAVPV